MTGGTLLVFPGAFKDSGLVSAMIILPFLSALEMWAMWLLIACCQAIAGGTYGDIGERAYGKLGRWAVEVSMLASQYGFACTEMLYVAKNGHTALVSFGLSNTPSLPAILMLIQLVVAPMAWIR